MQTMNIQFFCFVVLISAAINVAATTDDDGLAIIGRAKAHIGLGGSTTDPQKDSKKRAKRADASSDQSTIEKTFNDQRSLVGAADMNYLSSDSLSEVDAWNWTSYCNFDADFYTFFNLQSTGLKSARQIPPDHASILPRFFNLSDTYYTVRSIYLTGIGGGYSYCPTAIVDGQLYSGVYLTLYVLPHSSLFNENVQQYTPGAACTRCQSGVNWCYNNLCRGDCDQYTSGCREFTNKNVASTPIPRPPLSGPRIYPKNSAFVGGAMSIFTLLGLLSAFRCFVQ